MIIETNEYYEQIKNISDNKSILDRKSPFTHTLVYLIDNRVVGFAIYDVMYEKVELIYIFVRKDCRNKRIATKLLDSLISSVNDKENITLEVNINNVGAIKLYEKAGFEKRSIREKYYNGIDGILMEKKLGVNFLN